MNQISALFKKEIMESVRNFKLFSLIIVFMIFGIISPLTALLMPEIMRIVMEDAGISFEMAPVSAIDSYVQFFSNINQLGLVIFVIVTGSILTNELSRNTLVNLVTKGLKRHNVIIVKFLYATILWTAVYVLSSVITYLYTIYYWGDPLENILLAFSLTWLFGIFLISIIMLASSIFKTSFLAVLFSVLAIVIAMIILSIHPTIAEYLPQYLISTNIGVLTGEITPGDIVPSVLTTVGAVIIMFGLSIFTFNKATI